MSAPVTTHLRVGYPTISTTETPQRRTMNTASSLLRTALLMTIGMAATASVAMAHPGHGEAGFLHGLVHPLAGLDHLLAMIAVGLLAVRMTGRRLWLFPAIFVAFMLAGGLMGLAGLATNMSAVEWMIAASVLVFALMVLGLPRVPVLATALIVGGFALFHGYAHVAEMGAAAPGGFVAGMILGTATLHTVGLAGGLALQKAGRGSVRYLRAAGACVAILFIVVLAAA
jgi:urease accessory protein